MTIYERIEELRANTNLESNPHETYLEAEAVLVALLSEQILGAEVHTNNDGIGTVLNSSGLTINNMIMTLAFSTDNTKCYAVEPVIAGKVFFSKFVNNPELFEAWNAINDFHAELTNQYIKIKNAEAEAERELKKKEAADKKASEKLEATKARSINAFENLVTSEHIKNTSAEFYYSLGWIAKHVGTISAAMPDYLLSAFERQFGTDYKPSVVDSNKKTVNGHSMQWTFSMKASIKKADDVIIPAYLESYLNTKRNFISDTAFVWDLVENYGFSFGKEQDLDNIRTYIPTEYMDFFDDGLAA